MATPSDRTVPGSWQASVGVASRIRNTMDALHGGRPILSGVGGVTAADGEAIDGFLKSMGFVEQLEPTDDANYLTAAVTYADVDMQVWYGRTDQVASIHVWFADLPRVNVAPVMRRLLELNFVVETGFFSIQEVAGDDRLYFGTARSAEGLDLVGFKRMCDWAASGYWRYCRDLIEEFELGEEPGESGV